MLSTEKFNSLNNFINTCTTEELLWISGYLAGYSKEKIRPEEKKNLNTNAPVTIIYATETGNSKKAATLINQKLKSEGIKCRLIAADHYNHSLLDKENCVIVVMSTQGEGEPPEQGRGFFNYLHNRAEPLPKLYFGILGLGSKSYPLFCQAAIDIEKQLNRLGALKLLPTGLCEEDYEPESQKWIIQFLNLYNIDYPKHEVKSTEILSSRIEKNEFLATLGTNILLNDIGSSQRVHHLEFDLAEDIPYVPGNAIGWIPENDTNEVRRILEITGYNSNEILKFKDNETTLFEILKSLANIDYLTLGTVKKISDKAAVLLPEERTSLFHLIKQHRAIASMPPGTLIDCLLPINPRLYTISSGPSAHTGQIHLTISQHLYTKNGLTFEGKASNLLINTLPGKQLKFFIHRQKSFQLPADDKNIILIGWGTGIAPFRAFIAERAARQANGKTWLVFSEDDREKDFYYQTELQNWQDEGVLNRLNVAFNSSVFKPKDLDKVLKDNSQEIIKWIDKGAYLFISGLKEPVGKQVEKSIAEIIQSEKNYSPEEANSLLKDLTREGRYAKELY